MWVTGEYYDGMRAVELAARGRLDAPEQADPFLRLDWFRRVWEQAAPGERPLIARARSGPAEAWLFLARTRPGRAVALANDHAHRFAPVFAGDPDPALRASLLRAMARRLRLFGLSHIALGAVPAADAALIARTFKGAGWVVSGRAAAPAYRLNAGGRHFEDYWDAAPASLHDQVAAGSRALNVEISDLLTPHIWDEVEMLGGADAFLRDLAEDATLDRTLRLGIARVGDAPVAAQLWTVAGGIATVHWRGADPAAGQLFPAAELTASMLRYLMNVDRAATIDLGTGADLADWADERQPLRRIDLFNPRAASGWAPAMGARLAGLVRRAPLD